MHIQCSMNHFFFSFFYSHSQVLTEFAVLLPKAFTKAENLCSKRLSCLVKTLPELTVRVTLSTAMCPGLNLSSLFSIIHAYAGLRSHRTQLCCCLCRAAGVFLAQERSQQELHAAIKRCFAVVNSSVSEGMSAAILEVSFCNVAMVSISGKTFFFI